MQCKHNIIIYKGPPNLKVLASARVHGLEIANRPPPARARQQRYSFCLFKTLFAMALIGVVATIPFWRSEFTPTSFNEYGLKHLNDSNVMISKLQKRDLASVTESTTPPSAPIIEVGWKIMDRSIFIKYLYFVAVILKFYIGTQVYRNPLVMCIFSKKNPWRISNAFSSPSLSLVQLLPSRAKCPPLRLAPV